MIRRNLAPALLLSVLVFSTSTAQAQEEPAQAKNDIEQAAAKAYSAIQKDYIKASRLFSKKYSAAKTRAEKSKVFRDFYPSAKFAARYLGLALEYPATSSGQKAVQTVLRTGKPAERKKALELLEKHHITSTAVGSSLMTMQYAFGYDPEPFLRKVIEKNKNVNVKGKATFVLARYLMRKNRGKASKEAIALMETVAKKYAKVPYGYRELTLGDKAAGTLFEMRNLAIGKTAPDISGIDVDGAKFKLSDYRGKVVVIDFWGDW